MNVPLDEYIEFEDGEGERMSEFISDGSDPFQEYEDRDYIEQLGKTRSERDMTILRLSTQGYAAREIVKEFPELGIKSKSQIYEILKSFLNDNI